MLQALHELRLWNFFEAELLQMRIVELRVEQLELACDQPRNEVDQRNLGCVGPAREHALAKKGSAKRDAVESLIMKIAKEKGFGNGFTSSCLVNFKSIVD